MTYELAKSQEPCDTDQEDCVAQEFLKPYLKPYAYGIAKYDKGVSKAGAYTRPLHSST
jgi:hypothetical protein